MSTTRYHHGNLRQALVDAAYEAARELGPDGLAVRELARRVGVSHNAAYRHFADREALVGEVSLRGFAELTEAGRSRMDAVDDADPVRRARRRLIELGRSYVGFALAEPGVFRVIFTAYPSLESVAELKDPDDDPLGQLNECLDDLVAVGYLAPTIRPGAEITCWSAVHGFAVLTTEGPLRMLPGADRDVMLDQMLGSIDRGYGATTGRHDPL